MREGLRKTHADAGRDGGPVTAVATGDPGATLLLLATTRWPNGLLLAHTFVSVGFSVQLLCVGANPAWNAGVCDCLHWDQRRPLESLGHAIESTRPLLIVPIDDRAAAFVRMLWPAANETTRQLIERSVGAPTSFDVLSSRVAFGDVARTLGLRTPPHSRVESVEDLRHFLARHPGPCVLKVDGTWGGRGVRLAASHDAAVASFRELSAPDPFDLKAALFEPFWLVDWRKSTLRNVSVQTYIQGRPGDVSMFCLSGELRSAMIAQAEACWFEIGPTTLLSLREERALIDKLRILTRNLQLSGFVGIDLIFPTEGEPFVIELNPRITPLCNIAPSAVTNPIRAAASAFLSGAIIIPDPPPVRSIYAHFPAAWQAHAADPRLSLCDEDRPSDNARLLSAVANANRLWPNIARRIAQLRRLRRQRKAPPSS